VINFEQRLLWSGLILRRLLGAALNKNLSDPWVGPDVAQAMSDAYEAICLTLTRHGVLDIPKVAIADAVASLALEGERDAARLAEFVLNVLLPKP
jgi:hypothetical protein